MFTIRQNSVAHWALRIAGLAICAVGVIYIPTNLSSSNIGLFASAYELVIAAMALNLVLGFSGQISIGHSAFYGIGAYTTAILVSRYDWSQGYTLYAGALLAFVIGCVAALPALRIKGIYLALVTLALGVLFPTLIRWKKLTWLTNGTRDIRGIKYKKLGDFEVFGLGPFDAFKGRAGERIFSYWLAFAIMVVAYLVCRGIVKSRAGRSLIAIRDNETAAAVMGVNVAVVKILIFGISAALTALAGSLFALRSDAASAGSTFVNLLGAIVFLLVVVVGGAGTLWGPIVGGIGYVLLDYYTRDLANSDNTIVEKLFGWVYGSPATLILAVILIAVVYLAPTGLVGTAKRLANRVVSVVPAPVGAAVGDTTGVDLAPEVEVTEEGDIVVPAVEQADVGSLAGADKGEET